MTVVEVSLDLFRHSRLELHRAKAINLTIDVVVFLAGAGVEVQVDAAHLGAGLQRLLCALDLAVLVMVTVSPSASALPTESTMVRAAELCLQYQS